MTQVATHLSSEQINHFVNVAHGDLVQVQQLLEAEPGLLGTVNELGETALGAAAHIGQQEIAHYLLEKGATLDICTAAMLGQVDEVAAFLADDPRLVSARGAHGIPLMFHAALSGNTAVSQLILDHGGNGIETALHAAVKYGHLGMVEWLLARGALTSIMDFYSRTPLEVAVEKGDEAITAVLRKHIDLSTLTPCPQCGERGWRVVVSVSGNRFEEGQTAVYQCHLCQARMGTSIQNAKRAT
ncbi:MAG: ankyrin repeat domain-containing protein [Chloroflexota bacterium]